MHLLNCSWNFGSMPAGPMLASLGCWCSAGASLWAGGSPFSAGVLEAFSGPSLPSIPACRSPESSGQRGPPSRKPTAPGRASACALEKTDRIEDAVLVPVFRRDVGEALGFLVVLALEIPVALEDVLFLLVVPDNLEVPGVAPMGRLGGSEASSVV